MSKPEPNNLEEEEEFKKIVEQRFKDELIPLGKDKTGEKLYLEFDFSSVAFDPINDKWRVGALWFQITDKEGKQKFTLWKQPEILLYKLETFSKKMEKWMTKKYNLVEFNNQKVSSEIKKIAESVEG